MLSEQRGHVWGGKGERVFPCAWFFPDPPSLRCAVLYQAVQTYRSLLSGLPYKTPQLGETPLSPATSPTASSSKAPPEESEQGVPQLLLLCYLTCPHVCQEIPVSAKKSKKRVSGPDSFVASNALAQRDNLQPG